jgi:hypothetical protein
MRRLQRETKKDGQGDRHRLTQRRVGLPLRLQDRLRDTRPELRIANAAAGGDEQVGAFHELRRMG